MSSPLVGAWEVQTDLYRGFMVYTESHFSHTLVEKNRKRFQGGEPTETEEAEAYRTMRAGSGTYTISGSVVTLDQQAPRNPNGSTEVIEFNIEGDQLTLEVVEGVGQGVVLQLRKVS